MRKLASIAAATVALVVAMPATADAADPLVWSVDGDVGNAGLPAGVGPGVPLGPNVSSARDGSRIEIAGSGEFSPEDRWIDGGGEYRILAPDGRTVASGRWKPTALTSYRDLGFEHGIPVLIAGVIRAPISLQGLGSGTLTFYCGAHDGDEELEGVYVRATGKRFEHIDAGSTTIEGS